MDIELLYVPHCPNLGAARRNVQDALRIAAVQASLREREVGTQEDAAAAGMHGSPTVLVDGRDPFPTSGEPSLSCRLYREGDRTLGAPSVEAVVAVIKP